MLNILIAMSIVFTACEKEDTNGINNCNVESISDIDGNIYDVVSIGNQCFSKANLNVSKFSNGEQIVKMV